MTKILLSLSLILFAGILLSACSSKEPLQINTPVFNQPTSKISPTSTEMSDQDLLKALESDSDTSVDASFDQIDQAIKSN